MARADCHTLLGYVPVPLTEENAWCVMWDDGGEGVIVHTSITEDEAVRVAKTLNHAFPQGPTWQWNADDRAELPEPEYVRS